MIKSKSRYLLLILLNVLIGGLVIFALFEYCYDSFENIFTNVHKFYEENSFSYFTTLSNIFVLLVSIISIPYLIISILKKEKISPKWLSVLRHISTTYIVITFLIVNLLLVWIVSEPFELYEGKEIITHVIVPLLMVVIFCLSDSKEISYKEAVIWALIPVCIYSFVYFLKVFIFKVWEDFYSVGFWYPYSIPLFLILFIGTSILISVFLLNIEKKLDKKT